MMAYVMLISISIVAGNSVRDRDPRGTNLRRDLRGGRRSWTTDSVCSDDLRQTLLTPPSTTMSEPVMNELSSEARKRAAAASSSGCASLSMGVYAV
jgi:hypothetical protein